MDTRLTGRRATIISFEVGALQTDNRQHTKSNPVKLIVRLEDEQDNRDIGAWFKTLVQFHYAPLNEAKWKALVETKPESIMVVSRGLNWRIYLKDFKEWLKCACQIAPKTTKKPKQ